MRQQLIFKISAALIFWVCLFIKCTQLTPKVLSGNLPCSEVWSLPTFVVLSCSRLSPCHCDKIWYSQSSVLSTEVDRQLQMAKLMAISLSKLVQFRSGLEPRPSKKLAVTGAALATRCTWPCSTQALCNSGAHQLFAIYNFKNPAGFPYNLPSLKLPQIYDLTADHICYTVSTTSSTKMSSFSLSDILWNV